MLYHATLGGLYLTIPVILILQLQHYKPQRSVSNAKLSFQDIGAGKGKYYAVNFPLRDGIDDDSYNNIFVPIMSKVMESYQPSAVVLQCGADSLSGDRLGCFNLTLKGHAKCVEFMKKYNLPLMLLGKLVSINLQLERKSNLSKLVQQTLTSRAKGDQNGFISSFCCHQIEIFFWIRNITIVLMLSKANKQPNGSPC